MRFVIVFLLLATCAGAQPIDPDPDGMGVYFDTEGMEYCIEVEDWIPGPGAGPGVIDAYLLVTRPDTPYPTIQAWEAQIIIVTNSYLPPVVSLTPGAADYDADPEDFVIGCGGVNAIPITGDATVIANIALEFLGFEGSAEVGIELYGVPGSLSFPDSPGYAAEAGFPSPCQCIFGTWGGVAGINGGTWQCDPGPIANEVMTWGTVKSLY